MFSIYESRLHSYPSKLMCFDALVACAKAPRKCEQKNLLPAFHPSQSPRRRLPEVEAHDAMTAAVADIDSPTSPEMLQVKLRGVGVRYLAYSTFSAKQGAERWRVVLPFDEPEPLSAWRPIQRGLSALLDGDTCASTASQMFFMPGTRQGGHYRWMVAEGPAVTADNDYLMALAEEYIEPPPALVLQECKKKPTLSLAHHGSNPIRQFNAEHCLDRVLTQFGYQRCGPSKYLSPFSRSGEPGVNVLLNSQGVERVYVHHASDPLCDGKAHDAFDVYRVLAWGGDSTAAIRSLMEVK